MKERHLQQFSWLPKLISLALVLSIVSCNCEGKGARKSKDQELPTMTLKAVKSEIRDGRKNPLLAWELEITAGVINIADYTSIRTVECFINKDYTMLDPTKSSTSPLPLRGSLSVSFTEVNHLTKGSQIVIGYRAMPIAIGASKSMKVQWEIQDKSGKTVAGPVEVRWTVAK